jgi:8-oxo-dGTP pyrophosphatase MutT (NUDIX family)
MIREFSAGGVVFKDGTVLVRRPTGGKDYRGNLGWSFPKGLIDEGEIPEEAAVREVAEEGGVVAKIVKKLGTIKYFYKNKDNLMVMKFVTFYLMEWVSDLPDGFGWETAEVKWVWTEEAKKMLVNKSEKELLLKI